MTTQAKKQTDVHGIVTRHLLHFMEMGIIPWRVQWKTHGLPTNFITRKPYRGINVILLAMLSFESNLFLTEKQLHTIGGRPKKNQRPTLATYWVKEDNGGEDKRLSSLRYTMVYNSTQCEGLEAPAPETREWEEPFEASKRIVRIMENKPNLLPDEIDFPSYDLSTDTVSMPQANEYKSGEAYYYDLFKMLAHSTAHESRLNRKEILERGALTDSFSREALIADMAAHYLCFQAGMNRVPLMDTLASIQGWKETLFEDSRLVVFAANQAQKAVDCILNRKAVD